MRPSRSVLMFPRRGVLVGTRTVAASAAAEAAAEE